MGFLFFSICMSTLLSLAGFLAPGDYWILCHKTNKEASTVLYSAVKHKEGQRALKNCSPLLLPSLFAKY